MKNDFQRGWQLGYEQGLKDEKLTLEALGKVSGVAQIIPSLEENRATLSVARKLRSILGLPTKREDQPDG